MKHRLIDQIVEYDKEDKFVYSSQLRLRKHEIYDARVAADLLSLPLASFLRAAIATVASEVLEQVSSDDLERLSSDGS